MRGVRCPAALYAQNVAFKFFLEGSYALYWKWKFRRDTATSYVGTPKCLPFVARRHATHPVYRYNPSGREGCLPLPSDVFTRQNSHHGSHAGMVETTPTFFPAAAQPTAGNTGSTSHGRRSAGSARPQRHRSSRPQPNENARKHIGSRRFETKNNSEKKAEWSRQNNQQPNECRKRAIRRRLPPAVGCRQRW